MRRTTAALLLLLSLSPACAPPHTIPTDQIEIVCFSGHSDRVELYFRPPDGLSCPGIRVEAEGNTRTISFLRGDGGGQVDAPATPSQSPVWTDSLVVSLPIPEHLRQGGGEFIVRYADDPGTKHSWRFTEP